MYAATTAATLLFIASAVLAQEVGFTGGDSVSGGPSAISNLNVNNGWQSDSSLFAGSGSGATGAGGNTFNNVIGSSFSTVNSNSANKDNIVINPSEISVSGNDGWTANGDGNHLGPVQNNFDGHGRVPFFKRGGDVVFADNHHQADVAAIGFIGAALPARPFVVPAAGYALQAPRFAEPVHQFIHPVYALYIPEYRPALAEHLVAEPVAAPIQAHWY
ncbi:hypothetical protein GQ54DRAFT_262366 [Martensiomyces pterosporus]|nr:hypothetical protein GQ54DRAFT_262366 [Martensiomyces pterosporus]